MGTVQPYGRRSAVLLAALALAVLALAELVIGGLYAGLRSPGAGRNASHAAPAPAVPAGPRERPGLSPNGVPSAPQTAASAAASTAGSGRSGALPRAGGLYFPSVAVLGAPGAAAASPGSGGLSAAPSIPVPAPAVSCQTDLPLSASPDAPYNFLCRSGDRPLTWPSSHLVIYDTGLSVLQLAALQLAVPQWEQAGGFSATFGSNPATADVVVTASPLGSGAPGYTEDGYTTVAYRCSPRCAYVHARVVLSSTASLTSTDWLSTLLHELGHVAGLNHVSRRGEVMYPYLTLTSPVLYAAGDRQGFQVLAAERATSP